MVLTNIPLEATEPMTEVHCGEKHKLSMNVAKNDYLCERKKIDCLHRPHLEIILVKSMQEQKFETCNRKLKRIFL